MINENSPGRIKMKGSYFMVSIALNIILLGLIIIVTLRYNIYNMAEKELYKFGLKNHATIREHERHYYQAKSVFSILPRIDSSIVFVGNSLTAGCPWAELFKNPRIRNRGIGNECALGVLERIDEVLSPPPKKIFFELGLSDLGRYFTPDEIIRTYEKIIDSSRILSPGVELFIQSLTPIDERLGPPTNKEIVLFNKQLEIFAGNKKCTYIDLHHLFVSKVGDLDSAYTFDGVHLNGKAYLLWKSAIDEYMK